MDSTKTIKDWEKDLKDAKKRYDKLTKQLNKAKSYAHGEMIVEDLEDCRQDIIELELIIQDLRREKKKEELLAET